MRLEPMEAAIRVMQRNYPHCLLAVLGGSASSGEYNEHSDLDIIIIERDGYDFSRKTIEAHGWIAEIFILSLSSYREYFDEGVLAANPSLQRMVAEGTVLRSLPEGEEVRADARNDLNYGPMPLSSSDIAEYRYILTEFLLDLTSPRREGEKWFTVHKIASTLCEFVLRANREWTGEGKMLFRLFNRYSPALGDRLEAALLAIYREDDPADLITLTEEALSPYGGRLLVGYEE
ncbi:nucleotidyltransferase domain-containing protein [Paenibacillus sp. Y412MC10]|uniref:nucleotidyltransferase domain-containing protein n=1 Tax=Geobacillus sp. (strain Y412MC10) TaxID=481743 RepID=UPI00017885B7|nr:nucleotidyltransferase domain-containing protein [Paenibacillus sp. Y412MC10]ACX66533.1 DNA polymerase beta domain protein region [Paenibacillus sp. Y412MC10]